jgi:hypothetical protein
LSKVRWLDRTLVLAPVYIGLCRSAEDLKKEMRRLRIPAADAPEFLSGGATASTMTFSNADNETACIVCIGDVRNHAPTSVAALLVHEAVHVWQEIKRNIGEATPSSEFEAYAIQRVSQTLMEAFLASEQK